ncbi:MAG TPA: YdcF family protein [Mycobacterium sp.]|jgi:uncharacterized SAM-binding protein YcdF (DUF218 family)
MRTPLWRRILRPLLWACLLLILAVGGGLPVYVRPQIDPLRPADAIVILGGFAESRYSYGLDLGLQGWAPTVVVSNPRGAGDVWERNFCAVPPPNVDVHCFVPDPPTTLGEARKLRSLAHEYGWRTVIVVTFRPHISRARYILEHCFGGALVMVAAPTAIPVKRWAFEYVYQTLGYLRAGFHRGC